MPQAPNPYLAQVAAAAVKAGIDPKWAQATLLTEDAPGNPSVVSPAGAVGLMQVEPGSAPGVNLLNPAANIQAGVNILAQNLKAAGGNKSKASAMYFDGPHAQTFGPKAYQYVQNVANNYNAAPGAMSAPATPNLDALAASAQKALDAPQAPAQTQAPVSTPNLDALENQAQQTLATETKQQTAQGGLGANFKAGAEDVLIRPGLALDKALNGTEVGTWMQHHNMLATPAQDAATYQQDTSNLGTTLPDQIARFGGQAVTAGPVLAAGGAAAGAGLEAAGVGLDAAGLGYGGNAARIAAQAVTGGGSGLIGRGAALAAQGAGQTAGFDALTGRPITPTGVALGAVANPLLAGGGAVAGDLGSRALSNITPKAVLAAKTVGNALIKDGVTPEEMANLGRNGNTLVDVGGANTRALAEGIANKPGEGSQILSSTLQNRVEAAPDAVRNAISDVLGSNGDIYDLDASVTQQQKETAGPLYEKAYAVGPVWNDTLANLLERPSVAAAWKKAQNIAGDEGIKLPQVFATDAEGQITGVKNVPDMQTWDYIKRGLDDVVQAHRNQLTGKIDTDAARSANNVKKQLVSTLDEANPAYAEARAAYAGPAAVQNAIQMGRQVFSQDNEITSQQISKMSPSEKQAFQAGVARAMLDRVDNTAPGQNAAAKLMKTPLVAKKVSAAFDNEGDFEKFANLMDDINQQAVSRNEIIGGSQTSRRLAAQGHDWVGTAKRAAYYGLSGRPLDAAASIGAGVMSHQALHGDPALESEIANLLTNPNKQAVANALISAHPGAARQIAGAAANTAGRGVRLYAVPSLTQPNALTTGNQ